MVLVVCLLALFVCLFADFGIVCCLLAIVCGCCLLCNCLLCSLCLFDWVFVWDIVVCVGWFWCNVVVFVICVFWWFLVFCLNVVTQLLVCFLSDLLVFILVFGLVYFVCWVDLLVNSVGLACFFVYYWFNFVVLILVYCGWFVCVLCVWCA